MRGPRRGVGAVPVTVALAVLLALGVAIATRNGAETSTASSTSAARAQTASPQALSMGGAVPAAAPATTATWSVRSWRSRVSYLDTVTFIDDQKGFVAGGGTLFVTHDGGASWTAASIPHVGGSIASISCMTASDCVGGGWTSSDAVQLLRTRDGGSSWQPARFPSGLRDLSHLTCWTSTRCLAVGQGSGQSPWELQSADGGQTWTAGAPPPSVLSLTVLECSPAGNCVAGGGSKPFQSFGPDGVGVIDHSTDGGRSWTATSLPTAPAICSTPPGGTFTCSGPAGTVAQGTSTPPWPPKALSCPTANLCIEENNGLTELSSNDGGATWQAVATNSPTCRQGQRICFSYLPEAAVFVTPLIGWRTTVSLCGGFNFATESYQSCPANVEKTTDGGRNWVVTASTDYLPSISCPDANHCWAVETTTSSGSVIATSDGGAHWSLQSVAGSGLLNNLTCATTSLCFAGGADANGDPSVSRSTDGGRSWTPSALPPPASKPTSPPFVGPRSSYVGGFACTTNSTCLASTTNAVYATHDAGRTWAAVASPNVVGTAVTLFGITCADPTGCVIATTDGLFRTVDGGVTWLPVGPRGAGSLSVECAPGGLCVADDLGDHASRKTGILVSTDAGATWKSSSITLPGDLNGTAIGADSKTPGQVYYLSCWSRKDCAGLGLGYTASGGQSWYVIRTSDAANSWSVRKLSSQVNYVGSLACSSSGDCLIAGSNADGAALWWLHSASIRPLDGPAWSRFGHISSLVCPALGRCVGTANSNDATFLFEVSVSTGDSGWSDTLPTPRDAFSNVGVDVESAAVATGAALFITFPSQLFNLTFQENYAEIVAWGRRARERFRRRGRRSRSKPIDDVAATGAADRLDPAEQHGSSRLAGAVAVVLTGALLGTLLDPSITFDTTTLAGYVGVGLALLTSMGCIALSLVLYRARRRLGSPLRLHAFPLGLVVAAGCVIVSRLVDFEPGYLYGVVCGVALGKQLREHEEAHIAALSTVATLVLAAASWMVWVPIHGAVHGAGFFGHVLDNALVALVMSGLVNTVIVLLPLRFLAGWTLIRWRKGVWAAMFALALFTVIAVLARTPASPGPHASPILVTAALFVVFGGGSVAFREYFSHRWRVAHGVQIYGLRAHIREVLSVRPAEVVEVLSAPGSAQVVMEEEEPSEPAS